MGQGERRGRDESWCLGCLHGAASSGPVAPLQTSLRLKCFRNTESSSEDVAQPQGGPEWAPEIKHQSDMGASPACSSQHSSQGRLGPSVHLPPSLQAQPSHPTAQRGAPPPGHVFLPFSVQALCGPVYNYVGVSDCYMVQKAVVVATRSDATFGRRTSELKVAQVTGCRRVFSLFSFTSNTNKPK